MEFKDYYATLGVEPSAGEAEIKTAYRRLARKYHPDVSKEAGAEDKFKAVNEAYEALRDPDRQSAAGDDIGLGLQEAVRIIDVHDRPGRVVLFAQDAAARIVDLDRGRSGVTRGLEQGSDHGQGQRRQHDRDDQDHVAADCRRNIAEIYRTARLWAKRILIVVVKDACLAGSVESV